MEKKPSDPITRADLDQWLGQLWKAVESLGFEVRLLGHAIEQRERNRVEGVLLNHAYKAVGPEMLAALKFAKGARTDPQTHLKIVNAIKEAEHALARAEAAASATFHIRCTGCGRERTLEIWQLTSQQAAGFHMTEVPPKLRCTGCGARGRDIEFRRDANPNR